MTSRCLLILLVATASAWLMGCGDDTSTFDDRVSLTIYHPDGVGLPLAEIENLRLSVLRNNSEVVAQTVTPALDRNADVPEIPFGSSLQFHAEGLDASGSTIAWGASPTFALLEDDGFIQLVIYLTPVGTISTLNAIFANNMVSPSPFPQNQGRSGHTATPLPDGRVLIIGGAVLTAEGSGLEMTTYEQILDTLVVYDPRSNYFDPLVNENGAPIRLSTPRAFHTASLSGNRIVVAGGLTQTPSNALAVTDAVDIVTINEDGTLTIASVGGLNDPRMKHAAAVTGNGGIALIGGEDFVDFASGPIYLDTVEFLPPGNDSFVQVATLSSPRSEVQATPLGERILISGGIDDNGPVAAVDLFSSSGGGGTVTNISALAQPRYGHTATPFGAGDRFVLFAGGLTEASATPTTSYEVFDSNSGRIDATLAGDMTTARAWATGHALRNGNVFQAGGLTEVGGTLESTALAELLVSTGDGTFEASLLPSSLNRGRYRIASVVTSGGVVLMFGGTIREGGELSSELSDYFNPGPPPALDGQ